jgi:hypothetical protein
MPKILFVNSKEGFRAVNLDQLRWASRNIDGDVFLHFDSTDSFTVTGKDAETCWETINELWRGSGKLGTPPESRTARVAVSRI